MRRITFKPLGTFGREGVVLSSLILASKDCNLNPKPRTLNPKPSTLKQESQKKTLSQKPPILNPEAYGKRICGLGFAIQGFGFIADEFYAIRRSLYDDRAMLFYRFVA